MCDLRSLFQPQKSSSRVREVNTEGSQQTPFLNSQTLLVVVEDDEVLLVLDPLMGGGLSML